MTRRNSPFSRQISTADKKPGIMAWAAKVWSRIWRKQPGGPVRQGVPQDLLTDILPDNDLRAREYERRRRQTGRPWR